MKKKSDKVKDLICPVCSRYGKFDGKHCGRCNTTFSRKKYRYKKKEAMLEEYRIGQYRERKVVSIDNKEIIKHDW